MSAVRPWNIVPAAAVKNIGNKFKPGSIFRTGVFLDFGNWLRWVGWHHFWPGRQYGLHWNDHAFEPDPQVKEAIRRLNLKDPYQYDQRIIRLHRGTLLTMNNERLPKEQWTKWDEETYYLEPYLEEIENEKHERVESSGIKPGFQLKTLGH